MKSGHTMTATLHHLIMEKVTTKINANEIFSNTYTVTDICQNWEQMKDKYVKLEEQLVSGASPTDLSVLDWNFHKNFKRFCTNLM